MNKYIFTTLLLTLLGACANNPLDTSSNGRSTNSQNSAQANSTQNSSLKDLDEPGAGIPRKGGGVEFQMKRIATFSPEPTITESSKVNASCSNNAKIELLDDQTKSLFDQPKFNAVMALGAETYKRRKVWENNTRKNTEVENSVRNGRAYTSLKSQQEKYEQDQANVTDRSGRINTRKLSNNILKKFGLNNNPQSNALNAKANAYEELFQNINYNKKVLAAQDTEITNQEKAYIQQLSTLYFSTLNKFKSVPVEQVSINVLGNFSKFRQNNTYQCIFERVGASTPWPKELIDDYKDYQSAYAQYAQAVISANSSSIIQKLNQPRSSDELKTTYYHMFETSDLREIVEKNPKIVEAFATRSNKLVAEEKQRYEAILRKQAEEAKHKEKARLAELQKRMKNNLAPTAEDVLPLALNKSMKRTSENSGFIVEKTSNNSYSMYIDLLGSKIKRGDYSIEISNVKCTPSGNKQSCTYQEKSSWVNVELFGAIVMPANIDMDSYNATFYWSKSGLLSDDIKSKGIITYDVGGGAPSSAGYDDSSDRRAGFVQESNNRFRYNMQKEQSRSTAPYDSSKEY